jgi:hypothetical protein
MWMVLVRLGRRLRRAASRGAGRGARLRVAILRAVGRPPEAHRGEHNGKYLSKFHAFRPRNNIENTSKSARHPAPPGGNGEIWYL